MIRLYVFLLDFLIPFLCDPDLQCICWKTRIFSLNQCKVPNVSYVFSILDSILEFYEKRST
jgi:hypothetical protein